jgi:hypothetical protein
MVYMMLKLNHKFFVFANELSLAGDPSLKSIRGRFSYKGTKLLLQKEHRR